MGARWEDMVCGGCSNVGTPMRVWAAAVIVLLAGCELRTAALAPAQGVLTIAGTPAADISIQFLPDEIVGWRCPTSFAVTDAAGRFRLATYEGHDGAVVGPHTVILVDTLEERPEQGQPRRAMPRLPPRLATVAGGLRAEVTAEGGTIALDVPAP